MRALLLTLTTCLLVLPAYAKYSGGSGTADDAYQIATAADLIALGNEPNDYNKHFILTADIDLDPNLPGCRVFDKAVIAPVTYVVGAGWLGSPFVGVFDGNRHTISHLTIRGQGYLGLFGQLGPWYAGVGQVKNLGVVDVSIRSSGDYVGGLVGQDDGTVTQCYSTGTVDGNDYVGGLAGLKLGTMTLCYSIGAVSGISYVGGLAGTNGGTLVECCSAGFVSGAEDCVGGLVGDNVGDIAASYSSAWVSGISCVGGLAGANGRILTRCYSTGSIRGVTDVGGLLGRGWSWSWPSEFKPWSHVIPGLATDCFWDIQVSGQSTSAGGTGNMTPEMQMAATYLEAGWDFVGEVENGGQDNWLILGGDDYPILVRLFFAFSPEPRDAATDVPQTATLAWRAATRAGGHHVYFGDDAQAVASATTETPFIYRGLQTAEKVSLHPGILAVNKTYYWRIDEIDRIDENAVWKGDLWSFSTSDLPVVSILDDFESYTDEIGARMYQTWIDGLGFVEPAPGNPGNGTGSFVGHDIWPGDTGYTTIAETAIIHGGKQSMPMDYDNDGILFEGTINERSATLFYSEAERTWGTPQDWTIEGADTLTLYFRGEPNNTQEPLYVGIEDSAGGIAVMVHPDAEAVVASEWQKWHIALGDVRAAGVDVAAVQKMVIGVGDCKNPKPGGTGRIYIDDIRLTRRMP